MAALADQAEDRRRLGSVAHVVEQQARRLFEEHAERAEDERSDRRRQVWMVAGQLPVARRPAPDRIGFDCALRSRRVERLFDPARGQGRDLENLRGPTEERCRTVEHEPLHHALGGTAQEQMDTAVRLAVQILLQQAWQLRADGDQGPPRANPPPSPEGDGIGRLLHCDRGRRASPGRSSEKIMHQKHYVAAT